MIAFPNGKINLGLHVVNKRADGFHDLETIFYPVALQDAIEIILNPSPAGNDPEWSATGLSVAGNQSDNSCINAYRLLKRDFPQLPSVRMHLHKVIPTGAGLGGGSADGAFTLQLLNKKFSLGISEKELIAYALSIGSDCPFFIVNQPSYATGRGEKLESITLDLSSYRVIIVYPGIHINTGWAFSQIAPPAKKESLKNIASMPVMEWRDQLKNDFEEVVFRQHPEIGRIKENLYQQGALYSSLSGSGSTVYGIFEKSVKPVMDFPDHYFVKIV